MIAATTNPEIAEMITLRRIGSLPCHAHWCQQEPERVADVSPVAGHGAGLRPGLLSSVEPIGIVGTPSCEEVLDCEAAVLGAAEAGPHVVVTGAADPGSVAPVMIPTPLLSNSAVAPAIALAMPALEHAVAEATPLDEPQLTPGVASGAAPKGIPVGAAAVPKVLMPSGDVTPIPGLGAGVPIPPTCA
jgi:hypothetical protein